MPEITLEEMEAEFAKEEAETKAAAEAAAAPPAPPAQPVAPEGSRWAGKSMGEIVAAMEATERALQISEQARLANRGQQQDQQQHEQPQQLSREQIQELFQTDPVAAMEYVTEQARIVAEANIGQRLGALQQGTVSAAEAEARRMFPLEFELFGNDIAQFANALPDKSVLTTGQGWKDVVAYIRGREGNLDRYIERKTKAVDPAAVARDAQAAAAGANFSSATRNAMPAEPSGGGQLDAVQMQIAQEFVNSGVFKTVDEYVKWNKMEGR